MKWLSAVGFVFLVSVLPAKADVSFSKSTYVEARGFWTKLHLTKDKGRYCSISGCREANLGAFKAGNVFTIGPCYFGYVTFDPNHDPKSGLREIEANYDVQNQQWVPEPQTGYDFGVVVTSPEASTPNASNGDETRDIDFNVPLEF